MIYAVQAVVGFRNTARRNAVMGNVQTRLSQEVTWGTTTTQAVDVSTGMPGAVAPPAMSVEVRFTQRAARDSFWDDVVAFMGTGLNGPTTSSYIQQHDCHHDGSGPCVAGSRIDY